MATHSPSVHTVIAVKRGVGQVEEVQCGIVLARDPRQGAEGQGEGGAEEEQGGGERMYHLLRQLWGL